MQYNVKVITKYVNIAYTTYITYNPSPPFNKTWNMYILTKLKNLEMVHIKG